MGYRIRIEARADILGAVQDRFNVDVPYIGKTEAMRLAERKAHELRCRWYGIPVHFVAIRATLK